MFTGIIRETGKIVKITNTTAPGTPNQTALTELMIECPAIASTRQKGDSISIDGVCLTVTKIGSASTSIKDPLTDPTVTTLGSPLPGHPTSTPSAPPSTFTVQAIPETLARTIIPTYKPNQAVNIETPMKLGDELHGHMVQGHVDFTGTVKAHKSDGTLTISFPLDQAKYLAFKGSVTVNGVSLTVSLLNEDSFEVSLIPETLATTNLKALTKGSPVNIEVDLIARYLDSLLQDKAKETTYSFLKERNLI